MIDIHATLELTRVYYNDLQNCLKDIYPGFEKYHVEKPIGHYCLGYEVIFENGQNVFVDIRQGKGYRYTQLMFGNYRNSANKNPDQEFLNWIEGQSIDIVDKENDLRYMITLVVNNGKKEEI